MAGPALKFDNLQAAKWTSDVLGVPRKSCGKTMTGAYQSFSVTAEINDKKQAVHFDLWNRGVSRDVFKVDLDEGASICLKAVKNRRDYEHTVIQHDKWSNDAVLGPLVNKILWHGKIKLQQERGV
jgi:hypothetical protein